ncbi:hypothetical protein [Luteolibacter sp. LG18]|uniref:hypothetical protein n=1 Tax=Luteolibacter sp. LG18 TaxID=2819286 RepID=UPI002B2C68D7|nr:hypothetical protein llg_23960 [Luteolibacter sp. LG18]
MDRLNTGARQPPMESEQLQAFNERLNQWISSQGFWFQLRYSMAGGSYSSATFHLLWLMFRIFLFLLVIGAGCGVYLVKRVDAKDFPKQMAATLGKHLSASQSKVEGFQRVQGHLNLRKLALTGGPDAYYSSINAYNVRCDMGLLDGLVGKWNPGSILVSRMDAEIRAGAEDAAEAGRHAESFLKEFPAFEANSLEVADATLRWGFSEYTRGKIENSHLNAQRSSDGWRLQFHGGRFTQNWLRGLEIERLVISANAAGLTVEEGEFKVGQDREGSVAGSVVFRNVKLASGDRPAVSGSVRLHRVSLESVLPERLAGFVEGSISGDFKLSGSTNSPDGIGLAGQVVLDGGDVLTLRDRIHLLRALSVVDAFNSYRKVSFTEGSLFVKSGGGTLDVRDVKLKAKGDVMNLAGRLRVRPPTGAEVEKALSRGPTSELAPVFASDVTYGGEGDTRSPDSSEDEKSDLSLKKAGEASQKPAPVDTGYFAKAGMGQVDTSKTVNQGKDAISRTLRYEGAFQISIPGDSFTRAPDLRSLYPADPATNRITIDVPIEGSIYEVTLKQAEDIYVKGRRRE